MTKAYNIRKELSALSSKKKAKFLNSYFKTEAGDYGAGDVFIGVTVPEQRRVARRHQAMPLSEIKKLLTSKIHEHRFTALEILVFQYEKSAKDADRKKIFDFYLRHRKHINNWDLVDTSAEYIVGHYLRNKPKDLLLTMARSKNIWDRRIAMVSTFHYIKHRSFEHTFKIAKLLMKDKHHLLHKAAGWMLREVGKKDVEMLINFLDAYRGEMPRTMLRYAIEKFPETVRKNYLSKPKLAVSR